MAKPVALQPVRQFLLLLLLSAVATSGHTSTDAVVYSDEELGFSLEIPGHWGSEGGGRQVVFSGPKDTLEWNTTINVQVVEKDKNTLDDIAELLNSQWRGNPVFREVESGTEDHNGRPARRFHILYRRDNNSMIFEQDQRVIEGPDHFYLLGYTAPEPLYAKHYDKMAQAVATFALKRAGSPSPDASIGGWSDGSSTGINNPAPGGSNELTLLGASFEFPEGWILRTLEAGRLVAFGPGDAADYSITIERVSQAVAGDSAYAVAMQLQQRLSDRGAVLLAMDQTQVQGRSTPFVVAAYPGLTSRGQAADFKHTQFVLPNGEYYLVASLAGPADGYAQVADLLRRLVNSFRAAGTR